MKTTSSTRDLAALAAAAISAGTVAVRRIEQGVGLNLTASDWSEIVRGSVGLDAGVRERLQSASARLKGDSRPVETNPFIAAHDAVFGC